MISHVTDALISFVALHPHWVGFAIFFATVMESMAILGSILPGTSMVIALSGITASFGGNIWLLVIWCSLGAVTGDGISFWLGHHYGDRFKSKWPFRSRPELLESGISFFQKNGSKSIFIGRFLPFTRAVVPLAAGMLGMSPVRFCIANTLSAIVWGLINVLPAAGIGMSLVLINQSSSRAAVMLGMFGVIFVLAYAIVHLVPRFFIWWLGFLATFIKSIKVKKSTRTYRIIAFFFGRNQRPSVVDIAWISLAMGLFLTFTTVLENVSADAPLERLDVAINTLMQGFRTPLGDTIMVVITTMGNSTVVVWGCAILLGGLLLFRAWQIFGLAAFALGGTILFISLLNWSLFKPRPIDIYSDSNTFSFLSSHAAYAGVLWGLIAVIGSRGLSRHMQTVVWTSALTISILIGLSQIYLSVHWPSDVMGGLLFGWLMVSLFGVFAQRVKDYSFSHSLLALATAAGLFLGWGIHTLATFDSDIVLYTPRQHTINQPMQTWLTGGWKKISAARIDLKGEYEEPIILQTAATKAELKQALATAGWSTAPAMGWLDATQFFRGKKELAALAPLPLLHNGRSAALTMISPNVSMDKRTILRLWYTGTETEVETEHRAILVASIVDEHIVHPVYGINILRNSATPYRETERLIEFLRKDPSLCLLETRPSAINGTSPWLILPRLHQTCPAGKNK